MSELRIGVVGLGWVAGAHIETFKKIQGARVTAICSRRKHDPKDLEAKYGVPLKAYPTMTRCWPRATSTS
jgi:predicted dehydrogenase